MSIVELKCGSLLTLQFRLRTNILLLLLLEVLCQSHKKDIIYCILLLLSSFQSHSACACELSFKVCHRHKGQRVYRIRECIPCGARIMRAYIHTNGTIIITTEIFHSCSHNLYQQQYSVQLLLWLIFKRSIFILLVVSSTIYHVDVGQQTM